MNRWSALALLLALAGALALRVPKLDTRPLHNDEAVNAVKVTELWQNGRYAYDPDEYHGPTLHYATLPFLWLSGARNANELDDATLRLAPVAFGAGLILLLLLFFDGLGRHATTWAALFIAISPAMVFYSRYFIHEMLLVFFTALAIGAGWRYFQTRAARWAVTFGVAVGLMFATKETFVLNLAAMGAAAVVAVLFEVRRARKSEGRNPNSESLQTANNPKPEIRRTAVGKWIALWNWKHVGLALGAAVVVWLLFFSSFFTNIHGLADSIRTYLPWLKRAGGHSPHIHPWNFYLERLAWFHPKKSPVWSEGLILTLAIIGAVVSLGGKKSALHRFIAAYTIVLLGLYCAISYKTPWCLLGFFHGMILLAGIGAAAMVEFFRARAVRGVMVVVLLAFTAQLTVQAWRGSFVYAADPKNPYVYAQTAPDVLNLVKRTEGIARLASAGFNTTIKIMAQESDYWPLPWYLRGFKNLGWYETLPADPLSPIIIVSSKLDARLDDKTDRKWIMVGITELRPGKFFEQYVELELWKKYVETLPRTED
jgi:uncharacterized protein (TIGR03663 family)